MKKAMEEHQKTFYQKENQHELAALKAEVKKSPYRPVLHIFPEAGLMNDPNGLAYFNGKYHVFFQWYPFAPVHGLKHWGHTASEDLVHWSPQELALIPDREYEKNGCYSGNALAFQDELYLFYTANYKTAQGKIPMQALAVMDQTGTIRKHPQPLITEQIPGLSGELRDPFVFERAGQFYMLLGGGKFTGPARKGFGDQGVLLLYRSADLLDWEYVGLIEVPIDTGYMLECPSLIEIDGKDVLFLSPMGMKKDGARFNNRFATIYLIGELDLEHLRFNVEQWDEMDAGFDFYAPQAFQGKEQPLLFGWFGCGEQEHPLAEQWKHGLTFPQTMSLANNKFTRYPAKEILAQFTEEQSINQPLIELTNATYVLKLTAGFDFQVGTQEDYWQFSYDQDTGQVTVSREQLRHKIDTAYGYERSTTLEKLSAVDVFVDWSFVEIYLNGGEKVFSFNVFQESSVIRSMTTSLAGSLSYYQG